MDFDYALVEETAKQLYIRVVLIAKVQSIISNDNSVNLQLLHKSELTQ